MTADIDRIKQQTPALLKEMGVQESGGRYFCPLCQPNPRDHRSPDMVMWKPGKLKCHKCGFSGSVIDLYMESRGVGFADALSHLEGKKYAKAMSEPVSVNQRPKKLFPTHDDAVNALVYRLGSPVAAWEYTVSGKLWMKVYRFQTGRGKEFRPVSRHENGWVIGRPQGLAPIYRYDDVVKSTGVVFAVEGEKAADALWSIGLVATTSPGGASAPSRCDWSVLKDKKVVLWPDNDAPGKKFSADIKLFLPQAQIWLPSCIKGQKEDAADFVARGGTAEQLRETYRKDMKQ